jgi:hypothetical protein
LFFGNFPFFDLLLQKCFLQKNESFDITLKKSRAQAKKKRKQGPNGPM